LVTIFLRADAPTGFDDQQRSSHKDGEISMPLRPKRNEGAEPQGTSTQADMPEGSVGNMVSVEQIRLRAYEIYLERGEQPGGELDDWLQAERELESEPLSRAQAG
jgi:DUF2934 family protein